jgi:hypothetical protein
MERKNGKWPQRLVMSAALLAAGPALAQMVPVAQHREIIASASVESMTCGNDSHFDSDQATGFEAWDAQVGAGVCGISGGAMQSSLMTSSEIWLETSGTLTPDGGLESMTYYTGSYDSTFSFTFTVSRTTAYTWSGTLAHPEVGDEDISPRVRLIGPDGLIYEMYCGEETTPFSTSGVLEPGQYTLSSAIGGETSGSNSQGGPPSHSSIELVFSMTPPACPSDWNSDGAVNSQDFFDYLNDFFAGSADFNYDGSTDPQDFFDFLNSFFAPPVGCA